MNSISESQIREQEFSTPEFLVSYPAILTPRIGYSGPPPPPPRVKSMSRETELLLLLLQLKSMSNTLSNG